MNDTNVIEKIDLSISPEEFASSALMNEHTLEQLMHNTVNRIIKEVRAIIGQEHPFYSQPDFSRCFELITELYGYGFKLESHALLSMTGDLIEEIYGNLMPYFRLNCKQFPTYQIPDKWRFQKPAPSIFGRLEIYLEDNHDRDGIMYFTFCRLGDQDMEDVMWNECAVAVQDLIAFAIREGMTECVSDSSDHNGEHVQETHSIPLQNLIEDQLQKIIKAYVQAGEDLVIL